MKSQTFQRFLKPKNFFPENGFFNFKQLNTVTCFNHNQQLKAQHNTQVKMSSTMEIRYKEFYNAFGQILRKTANYTGRDANVFIGRCFEAYMKNGKQGILSLLDELYYCYPTTAYAYLHAADEIANISEVS